MKAFPRIAILFVGLSVLALVTYLMLPPSESGQRAVQQLKSVRIFSLGPVGPSGSIPESVDQFFAILDSRHSSRLFRELYEHGTAEAKVYALCGLWLTRGGFDSYAGRFPHEVEKVSTFSSCFRNECAPSEIVNAIREGALDHQLMLFPR
ncbi:MAG: hypothetical protein JNG86_21345 [Verrucomicrobiaceae bacterium]|nr:hypothetical protein [Verrucomicrobiaceae bacterium]